MFLQAIELSYDQRLDFHKFRKASIIAIRKITLFFERVKVLKEY
jgi:hypothetical protein